VADPPVLLVHGFASSFVRNWVEPGWVDLLADAGRTVIPVDLLGHGDAPKPHDPAAYADLEGSVSEAFGDGPVDAIGFSLGARLLLGVAAEQPERFDRIVVAGVGERAFLGNGPGDQEAAAQAVERGEPAPGDPVSVQAFSRFSRAPGNDPAALAACLRRPTTPFDIASLARLTRPVLVVLGDQDFVGPAEPLVDALPDGQLLRLAGLDHFATPKDFRFIEAALAFIGADPG
jgi:pimeloyl-ACP methyl ester carboxylesterase